MRVRALAITVLLAVLSVPLLAGAEEQFKDSELRAAKALEAIRGDPLALYAFLKRMPKGADLHNHLDGAVYAETFIRVGGEDGLCVDPVAKSFTKSHCWPLGLDRRGPIAKHRLRSTTASSAPGSRPAAAPPNGCARTSKWRNPPLRPATAR